MRRIIVRCIVSLVAIVVIVRWMKTEDVARPQPKVEPVAQNLEDGVETPVVLEGPEARTGEWTQFRGPTGQGLCSTRLPIEWDQQKNVAWKQAVPGHGWSSPIVAAGRIFLTTAVPGANNDQSLRALAFDAATGKPLWDTEVFLQDGATSPKIHAKNSHASPTAVADGKQLFVHFGHQGSACLNLDGKVLWRNRSLKYKPVHGNGGSPVVVEDLVIFHADGSDHQAVVALDRLTGKVRWRTERGLGSKRGNSFGTPLLIDHAGRQQFVCPASEGVIAYDPATGQELWKVRYDGYSVVPRPAYGSGLVFVSTGYDAAKLLAIRPDGQGDVTDTHVQWKYAKNVPLNPSPLVVNDRLYIVSDTGIATCLNSRTGKVHWQRRLEGQFAASPFFAAGKVYFQSEDGQTIVVEESKELREVARSSLGERTFASYAIDGEALILRSEKHLYRIQAGEVASR